MPTVCFLRLQLSQNVIKMAVADVSHHRTRCFRSIERATSTVASPGGENLPPSLSDPTWTDKAARRGSTEAEVIRRPIDRPTYLRVRTGPGGVDGGSEGEGVLLTLHQRPAVSLDTCMMLSLPRGSASPPSSAGPAWSLTALPGVRRPGNNAPRPASAPYLPPLVSDRGSTAFLIIISPPNEWDVGSVVRRSAPRAGFVLSVWRPSFLDEVERMKRDDLIMIRSPVLLSFLYILYVRAQIYNSARTSSALLECVTSHFHCVYRITRQFFSV